jgi:hypothetical protein
MMHTAVRSPCGRVEVEGVVKDQDIACAGKWHNAVVSGCSMGILWTYAGSPCVRWWCDGCHSRC